MGWPPKKTVYGAAVQTLPMSDCDSLYESMLNINLSYLDGYVDAVGWANLYHKSGKYNLKKMSKYVQYLIKKGINPFNNYITINPEKTYDEDQDELLELLYHNIGHNKDDIEKIVLNVINPNYDELGWIKYQLDGYNLIDDNIEIDGTIYTIKDYNFYSRYIIQVFLVDADGNVIEKAVNAYEMLDTEVEPLIARQYLVAEYILKTDTTKKYAYLYALPYSGTTTKWIFTDIYGNSFDFTKKEDKRIPVLPLIPLKMGGDGMGWQSSKSFIGEWRYLPKNSKFRKIDSTIAKQEERIAIIEQKIAEATTEAEKKKLEERLKDAKKTLELYKDFKNWSSTDQADLTGIPRDPHNAVKEYYENEDIRAKLPKNAMWGNEDKLYPLLKKICKRGGSNYESLMCVIYDSQCGFNGQDTSTMREQLYDCFWSYGCPMHAIKNTNTLTQPNSSYNTIIKELEADTKHPYVAQYAKYTRFTKDEMFETDKSSDGSYHHNHFGQIVPKKYKTCTQKAIAKYCFKFFDMFQGTSTGKEVSILQTHNTYHATHTWKQYSKETKSGKYKYRYNYDFSATIGKTMYFYEIEFTGKYEPRCKAVYTGGSTPDAGGGGGGGSRFSHWEVYYYPIYAIKKYQCQCESSIDNDENIYEKLNGIPIYTDYYEQQDNSESYDQRTRYTYSYKETKLTGRVLNSNPVEQLNVTFKRLISMKETSSIEESNILFAGAELTCKEWAYKKQDDGDGHDTSYWYQTDYTIKGYCTSKDCITTVAYDAYDIVDDSKANLRNIKYSFEDIYYDDTRLDDGTLKYRDKNNPPTIRTDISYEPWTKTLFSETGKTYIALVNDDDYEGERIVFAYYHKLSSTQYERIRIEDYSVDFVVNPYEGGQHKAGSLSCLAPDGNSFLPIVLDVIDKVSFYDAYIITRYASKQYWSYWMKKKIRMSWLSFVIILVFTTPFIAFASDNAQFSALKAVGQIFEVIGDILGLNFIFKIFGLNDTIFQKVVSALIEICLTIISGGSYLMIAIAVVCILICMAMAIWTMETNHSLERAEHEFDKKMGIYNDKMLELENQNVLDTIGLTTRDAAARVHRILHSLFTTDVFGDLSKNLKLPECTIENKFACMYQAPAILVQTSTKVDLGR